jgi:hypothetical protein
MAHTYADFIVTNAIDADREKLDLALSYLDRSPDGNSIIQQIVDRNVIINIVHDRKNEYDPETNTISWDPNSGMTVKSSGIGSVGVRSPALIFIHEAAHAIDPNLEDNVLTDDDQYDNLAEKYAAEKENAVASYHGEPQRFNHDGEYLTVFNPTEHTAVATDGTVKWVQSDKAGNVTIQGDFEYGTFPDSAPVGGGTGTGTLTIDGSDITVSPGTPRAVIIKGDNVTVIEDGASITVSSGGSATIVGDGNSVALENTGSGSLELSGTGNKITSGSDTISVGPGTSSINYNAQQKVADVTTTSDNGTSTKTVFDTGTEAWSSETSAFDAYQRLQSQRVVLDGGGQQVKQYDPNNTHPYDEVDIDEDSAGKPTAVQMKIDGQNVTAAAASVGQVLGSALGRALAPNNQFGQIIHVLTTLKQERRGWPGRSPAMTDAAFPVRPSQATTR